VDDAIVREIARDSHDVKLADLDDHIGLARANGHAQPPYQWARRHVIASQYRRQERSAPQAREALPD
jgi:hypothetical protein